MVKGSCFAGNSAMIHHNLKVKLSRFFEWSGKWKNVAPYWSFLKFVYKSFRLIRGNDTTADEEDLDERTDPPGTESQQSKPKSEHLKLIQDFKDMQKSRHTLDVVNDVLHDDRIKLYAWMMLWLILLCSEFEMFERSFPLFNLTRFPLLNQCTMNLLFRSNPT